MVGHGKTKRLAALSLFQNGTDRVLIRTCDEVMSPFYILSPSAVMSRDKLR